MGCWFSSPLAPLVRVTLGFVVKDCKRIAFSMEVYEFLAKNVILVKRSDIFVVKACKRIEFSTDVYAFLATNYILVRGLTFVW